MGRKVISGIPAGKAARIRSALGSLRLIDSRPAKRRYGGTHTRTLLLFPGLDTKSLFSTPCNIRVSQVRL